MFFTFRKEFFKFAIHRSWRVNRFASLRLFMVFNAPGADMHEGGGVKRSMIPPPLLKKGGVISIFWPALFGRTNLTNCCTVHSMATTLFFLHDSTKLYLLTLCVGPRKSPRLNFQFRLFALMRLSIVLKICLRCYSLFTCTMNWCYGTPEFYQKRYCQGAESV